MNKKKIIILSAIITLVIIAIVVMRKKIQANQLPANKITENPVKIGGKISMPPIPRISGMDFPLKKGSRGNAVRRLQKWINNNPPVPYRQGFLTEDGIFGDKTLTAVMKKLHMDKVDYQTFIKNKM